MVKLGKAEKIVVVFGVILSVVFGIVCTLLITIPQTQATWSKTVTLNGEVIKNGDLSVTVGDSVEVIPGANNQVPGWDTSQSCTSGSVTNQPDGSSGKLMTGALDKSFRLRFPIDVVTIGNNLVAIGEVEGTVDQGENHDRYRFSDWKITDSAGASVTHVDTGTYYVEANIERNSINGESGASLSSIGESVKQSIHFNSVQVTIRQERQ